MRAKPFQPVVFVGIDRGMQRKFRTRKNMARLIGISFDEFCERFTWENLYGDETREDRPPAESRIQAECLRRRFVSDQRIVLLGTEVASAFGVTKQSKYEWFALADSSAVAAKMIHTSNFHWNMPSRQAELWGPAREFAKSLLSYV